MTSIFEIINSLWSTLKTRLANIAVIYDHPQPGREGFHFADLRHTEKERRGRTIARAEVIITLIYAERISEETDKVKFYIEKMQEIRKYIGNETDYLTECTSLLVDSDYRVFSSEDTLIAEIALTIHFEIMGEIYVA